MNESTSLAELKTATMYDNPRSCRATMQRLLHFEGDFVKICSEIRCANNATSAASILDEQFLHGPSQSFQHQRVSAAWATTSASLLIIALPIRHLIHVLLYNRIWFRFHQTTTTHFIVRRLRHLWLRLIGFWPSWLSFWRIYIALGSLLSAVHS